jgi:hypothetical protein
MNREMVRDKAIRYGFIRVPLFNYLLRQEDIGKESEWFAKRSRNQFRFSETDRCLGVRVFDKDYTDGQILGIPYAPGHAVIARFEIEIRKIFLQLGAVPHGGH